MHLKGEKYSRDKNNKIQLIGVTAANMCGEKIPMFVKGKSKKSRCFKRIRHTQCRYRAQKRVGWTLNYLKGGSENRTESSR